jgi:hypothetical protein
LEGAKVKIASRSGNRQGVSKEAETSCVDCSAQSTKTRAEHAILHQITGDHPNMVARIPIYTFYTNHQLIWEKAVAPFQGQKVSAAENH